MKAIRMGLLPNLVLLFTYISTALSQSFLSFDVSPAPQIEWDQLPYAYYTGQTINTTWASQGFQIADLARITYPGAGGTRTLTTGSGTPITNGLYAVRLSDSSNGLATNVALTIALSTTTSINRVSNQSLSVLQSRVTNILPLDGNRTLGGGQTTVCDDRSLTVQWRGLGQAQFGVASITLRRQSGFLGTQTLVSLSNQAVSGNVSFSLVCPRTATPSGSNPYAFEISVQEPGGNAYTGTSASFTVGTAPTPSPTSSQTPTSSKTATPTPSSTPSPTPSPSSTMTPTPSITSSPTMTPSTTETARASIDYAAIGKAAASQVDTTTPAIAGALGGIGGILVLIGAVKWYQNKQMTERRKQKQAMTSRFVQQASSMYGIHENEQEVSSTQPSIVMYTVASLPQRSSDSKSLTSIKKGFTPKHISK